MKLSIQKPIQRSKLRARVGMLFYGTLRHTYWLKHRKEFSREIFNGSLNFIYFAHKSPLYRKLKDVDMWYQHNKVINLRIAVKQLNGMLISSGETFSYWKIIGKPTKKKGYVEGMVLKNGIFSAAIGGGLCQLSNLIFWMTAHTPLTITERHRHGYDVFPDANRTQPFGSGATCFYPHGDLMIKNETPDTYQLILYLEQENLVGEWRVSREPEAEYKIVEKYHEMRSEFWGGYSRHNELHQQKFTKCGEFIQENLFIQNSAIMMYAPFLENMNMDKKDIL